ncbi:heme ABC exporter ATP-binding protein CcmA [Planctomycetota bacterium]
MSQKAHQTMGPEPAIDIAGLCMAYETRLVLNRINLQIPAAEALCLCGANGAGKSTLLRIIAGLLHPTEGQVQIKGFDIRKDPQAAKPLIGVISHKSMLYPDLTVAENLIFAARLYGVKKLSQRVEQLLEDVKLAGYRFDKTSILSRGMLQRLAISRALVHQPRILLADEPFTGLDLPSCRHLVDVLHQFRDEGGTIIMTTHEINFGLNCCNRVVVLDEAKIIFDAPTDQIDRARFVDDYLSYARKNS